MHSKGVLVIIQSDACWLFMHNMNISLDQNLFSLIHLFCLLKSTYAKTIMKLIQLRQANVKVWMCDFLFHKHGHCWTFVREIIIHSCKVIYNQSDLYKSITFILLDYPSYSYRISIKLKHRLWYSLLCLVRFE